MHSRAVRAAAAAAAAACLLLSAASVALAEPRCDGFPPRDHRAATPRGDVVGWVAGACTGQLFPVVSSANTDADLASIISLKVEKPPRYGRFEMVSLRNFRYTPAAGIRGKGWDEVGLRLTYRLPNNQTVSKLVQLRLTIESEYQRMRAGGALN